MLWNYELETPCSYLKSPAVNLASANEKAASLITSPISILVWERINQQQQNHTVISSWNSILYKVSESKTDLVMRKHKAQVLDNFDHGPNNIRKPWALKLKYTQKGGSGTCF